ncbi:MAG: hypothetical protein RLY20_3111 [Verrucomicrobiota bacterium]|jgi:hypothetical protein
MNNTTTRKLSLRRIIGLGLLAFIAVLLLWNALWRMSNNRAVARLEAAARQRGEPVTLRELAEAYPQVPDAENIHRALMKVWMAEDSPFWTAYMNGTRPLPARQDEKFKQTLPLVGGNRLDYTNGISAAVLADVREFLVQKKAHMQDVRAALKLKAYSANYDFKQSYAMLLPELAVLKKEAQFFALEALDATAAKDNARAIAAIADIGRVGDCQKADPLLIGQLVRIACYQIAISTSERLLKVRTLTSAECAQLEAVLNSFEQDDGMKRAMIGERTFGWDVLDAPPGQIANLVNFGPGDETPSPAASAFGFRAMRWLGMTGAEKRLMGETYEEIIRTLSKPDYAATDELKNAFETMSKRARTFPPKVLTLMLMPALEKAGEKAARLEASRRCALAALAVERYRLAHRGALPATLSDVGAGALEDPFTGKPLLLKKTERGYLIYSVGPDRKDDDGEVSVGSSSSERRSDIGFRVEHP